VDFSTILQVFFYNNNPRTLLRQSWLNHQGQLEEGKRKGGIFPLMLPPPPSFSTGSASIPSARSGAATTSSEDEKHVVFSKATSSRIKVSIVEVCNKTSRAWVQVKGGR
jgi:hypothetical protein